MPPQPTAQPCFKGRVDGVATTGTATFDAWPDRSLLASMEAGGLPWPSSCRNGTCRTCLCQMTQGQVAYRIEWPGLSAEEKAGGFILPCVAYPVADVVLRAEPARWL